MKSSAKPDALIHKIKFEIIPEEITVPDIYEEIRWEDDGGLIPDRTHLINESELLLKPGSIFKIHSGKKVREGDRIFYIAEIEFLN